MIILGIPDIHGDIEKLLKISNEISSADLILLVGDLTNFGREKEILEIIRIVKQLNHQMLVVPGNCDYPETDDVLNKTGLNINGQYQVINNITFIGLGAALITPFNATPNEVSDGYLEQQLHKAVSDLSSDLPRILVTHQPPFDTSVDVLSDGMHVGSKSVRKFIEMYKPIACFTGHIHEGAGIDSIGETTIVNPGPLFKGNFAYAEITDKVEKMEIRQF